MRVPLLDASHCMINTRPIHMKSSSSFILFLNLILHQVYHHHHQREKEETKMSNEKIQNSFHFVSKICTYKCRSNILSVFFFGVSHVCQKKTFDFIFLLLFLQYSLYNNISNVCATCIPFNFDRCCNIYQFCVYDFSLF